MIDKMTTFVTRYNVIICPHYQYIFSKILQFITVTILHRTFSPFLFHGHLDNELVPLLPPLLLLLLLHHGDEVHGVRHRVTRDWRFGFCRNFIHFYNHLHNII